ncbi:MAG TPA: proprotein convertase P-domain-containing protein, partial [Myxococcota bacterium]|nr:proprotein convertase P-domain-containing protein [Myxococcota bacterium]
PCRLDAPCQPGAVCGGASRGDGVCVDASLTGSFAVAAGTIPDGDPDGLVIEIPVSGLGTVAEDVLLALDLHHPEPSQLEITLTMPDGDSAVVHDHAALDGGTWSLRRPAALPADTSIHGTWTLRVVDATPGDAGTVDGGALELVSRWD